ncbi:AAA family ATPase [Streptomyces sp. CRN 30]|uniref:AAA family ATPase n=1 Tax=Streptomyces sp. CRN 30 TaxID=3075613 RepID=UPI002A826A79|nr:AAA family ATPase [Streptomyces sp. CRN 30]
MFDSDGEGTQEGRDPVGPGGAGELLDGLERGESRLLVVEGGPGHGRSTALGRLVASARRRGRTDAALVRCGRDESAFDWGLVRQVLDALPGPADASPVRNRLQVRDEHWFAAVREGDSWETLQRLYWLIAERAVERPLVLAVDDVHWCDPPSLRLLGQLVRRLHQLPLLLAVSVDPVERSGAEQLLMDVVNAPGRLWWSPPALGRSEVTALGQEFLGDGGEAVVQACLEVTGGVPGLVVEVLRMASRATPGETPEQAVRRCEPPAVASAALSRAARHGEATAHALRVLSVLRSPVPARQAARLLNLEPAESADTLAVLERLGYLVAGSDGVLIAPEALRRAVRARMRPSERHRAESLAARVLVGRPETLNEAAGHLLAVLPEGDARHVRILQASGRRMLAAGRYPYAARLLRRALQEPPTDEDRAEILADLGLAELYRDPRSAVEHLRPAVAGADSPEERLLWTLRLTHALAITGEAAEGHRVLWAELEQTPLRSSHELVRRAAAELFFLVLSDDDTARARHRSVDGSDWTGLPRQKAPLLPARAVRLSRASRALAGAFACHTSGELVGGIHDALSSGPEPTDESSMGWLAIGSILLWADDLTAADRVFGRAAEEAERWNAPLPRYTALWLHALVAVNAGRLAEARRLTATAVGLARERPWDVWAAGPSIVAMRLAEECGGESTAAFEPLVGEPGGEVPRLWVADLALAGRGRLRVVEGDVSAGLADLLEAGRRLLAIGCLNPAMSPWRSAAALALARLGRADEAHPLADEEVRLARAWGAPRALAVALRRRGVLRGGDQGLADVEESLSLLADQRFPLESARTLLAQGGLHRSRRSHDPARDALTEAYRLAGQCEADRLAGRIREELLAVGGRPRISRSAGFSPLAPAEWRVARLAADGATNQGIAEHLFLARRTVEAHLTSAYRKLGIRGRSQLPEALRQFAADGFPEDDGAAPTGEGTDIPAGRPR